MLAQNYAKISILNKMVTNSKKQSHHSQHRNLSKTYYCLASTKHILKEWRKAVIQMLDHNTTSKDHHVMLQPPHPALTKSGTINLMTNIT